MNETDVEKWADEAARDVVVLLRRNGFDFGSELRAAIHDMVVREMRGLAAEVVRQRDPPLADHIEALAKALWTGVDRVGIETDPEPKSEYRSTVYAYAGGDCFEALRGPVAPTPHLAERALRDELRKRVQEQQESAAKALRETE